jgi:type IV pilus assembly protein PilX
VNAPHLPVSTQRGVALVTSLILLLIITIIALSMFRSFATQEHIAGNLREKERALAAAVSAQQYAEWWLTQGNNVTVGAVPCAPGTLNANDNAGQICTQTLVEQFGAAGVTTIPWPIQVTYLPLGMGSVEAGVTGTNGDPPYALTPAFYIADVGPAGDGLGEAYLVDAYGSGSTQGATLATTPTIAVVESLYEVKQGVSCMSCL